MQQTRTASLCSQLTPTVRPRRRAHVIQRPEAAIRALPLTALSSALAFLVSCTPTPRLAPASALQLSVRSEPACLGTTAALVELELENVSHDTVTVSQWPGPLVPQCCCALPDGRESCTVHGLLLLPNDSSEDRRWRLQLPPGASLFASHLHHFPSATECTRRSLNIVWKQYESWDGEGPPTAAVDIPLPTPVQVPCSSVVP